ncbi:MAG: hypothetical protein Q7R81_06525 [Candidatus Peregrinibacteria bacterium]|nr:hypothetical protein [Candidatus Peregrinibacteria bacterium]
MAVILHLLLAFSSVAIIWFLSGILIEATDRVAKRYHQSGFSVAFFILGFLTSISEASVAVNATIQGVPQVSAGNLIGASLVIFLLIIPVLAITANGITMRLGLTRKNLRLLLFVVLLPALLVLDGAVSRNEGLIMLLVYASLIYAVQKKRGKVKSTGNTAEEDFVTRKHATAADMVKILIGGVLIFVAGKILVDEAIYFSAILRVPPSFIGLLVLSIGTNVPELAIALRCVFGRHTSIAFGDYMGSAAANTLILGLLSLANGEFILERSEFISTFLLLTIGLVLFSVFAQSKSILSRREGLVLLSLYVFFLISQLVNVSQIIPTVQGAASLARIL